jgi:hypothetical protein
MSQSHRRSGRPVVKDNVVLNARRASGKPKSNATSFKRGRKKTGGRKAGTPNKTTWVLREAALTAAEAAGNEVGGDGLISYLTWVALNHPTNFLPLLVRSMPQQLEPEQTSPPEEEEKVLHTIEEVREELRLRGVPPDAFARALLRESAEGLPEQEHSGTAGLTSSTDDRGVEDDASYASTRGG